MSTFDEICASAAFVLGLVLVVLGVLGLFFGCEAHFSLPPVLGIIPALVGWGIVRTVRIARRLSVAPEIHRPKSPRDGDASSGEEATSG